MINEDLQATSKQQLTDSVQSFADVESQWSALKCSTFEIAVKVIGVKKRRHQERFDENDYRDFYPLGLEISSTGWSKK